jgi:transglutaminase-like putative cysteine protease
MPDNRRNPDRGRTQTGAARAGAVSDPQSDTSAAIVNDLVAFAAAFAVSASGVFAVTMSLDDPTMTRVFVFVLAIGFVVSWFVRRIERVRSYAVAWTAVAAGAALLFYRESGTFLGQPLEAIIAGDRQLAVASLLGGFAIVRSFGIITVEDLLFCVVPSLAIFGLLGSKTFDPQFTTAFLIFAFSAAYLAGHTHLVAERRRSRMPLGEDARRVARERFALLAALFAAALLLSLPVARAAAALVPTYRPRISSGSARPSPGGTATAGRPVWTSIQSLPVGTGPVRLSRQVVMHVTCDEPLYWRATSLTRYTGASWLASERPSVALFGSGGRYDLRGIVESAPGRAVRQEFSLEGSSSIVYGAMQPVELQPPPGVSAAGPISIGSQGGVSIGGRRTEHLRRYSIISQVDNLRPAQPDSVLAADDPELLSIPFSARQVSDLAREAVGEITDPQAQVAAIVGWVQARARYSLDAPETPAGEDAVIYFLTTSQVGYCDLFASSVALMCRATGIPARVAIGFATGEFDSTLGEYVVREEDSHAWVEAYLADQGWITVEASPATAQQARVATQRTWFGRFTRFLTGNALMVALALAVLAWGALTVKSRWIDELMALRRQQRALLAQGDRGTVILLYANLLRALARRGFARRQFETPNEYAGRLGKNAYLATIVPGVAAVTGAYLVARFSEREVGGDIVQSARQSLNDVTQRLRAIKRIR